MKNELIQLAKEKKFSSNIISEEPWKYSVNEDLRWLFWMTALQKWLREVHNIEVIVKSWIEGGNLVLLHSINQLGKPSSYLNKLNTDTYEASLEEGLYNALQLIK